MPPLVPDTFLGVEIGAGLLMVLLVATVLAAIVVIVTSLARGEVPR